MPSGTYRRVLEYFFQKIPGLTVPIMSESFKQLEKKRRVGGEK
jgi:hypothetical protein